jgi:hypothetical protein
MDVVGDQSGFALQILQAELTRDRIQHSLEIEGLHCFLASASCCLETLLIIIVSRND